MTQEPYRILLVGSSDRLPAEWSDRIEEHAANALRAEATAAVGDALARLSEKGYDAVACWVEEKSDLAGVIRIRKARPDVPIVVFHSEEDTRFEALALEAGATRTTRPAEDARALSDFFLEALRSGDLRRELESQARWSHYQAREVRQLAQETHARSRELRTTVRLRGTRRFEPVLVEDDPDQAFLIVRAFQKAAVTTPYPVLRSGEEAISFLSERRDRRDLPTLVILDVDLPGKSGLDVLTWIRAERGLFTLPIVMFSGSAYPESVNRAYELGANSYLVKPTGFSALVELVRTLKAFWGQANQPPDMP